MSRQPAAKRAQRLQEIAREVGAVLNDFDPTPLIPPNQLPTFTSHDDDRKADTVLGQLRIEESGSKQQSRRISSAFGKKEKQTVFTYGELYQAMVRTVQENGEPGVLEVLLKRFKAVEGNVNLANRANTGVMRRVRGKEEKEERGQLIQIATRIHRLDFVQLLAPLADDQSLNESLDAALGIRALDIIELLVRYGANVERFESTFINIARHGDVELLQILLRSKKRVSQQCLDQSLLPATAFGSLHCVLLLAWAGANADHEGASSLLHAVEAENVELATAIIAARNPPSGQSLDRALHSMFSRPSSPSPATDGQHILMEALLCGGPTGDAANLGLQRATFLANTAMMQLLLSYQVDINFDGACAVGHAISRNRADLMGTLLQDQTLKPEIASELVRNIPAKASSMDRVALLSKLLVNGASGTHCSLQLIIATECNDLETARLLVTYGAQNNGSPVCSVNYNGARCLKTAVHRNNIEMVKILALEGDPSNFSLAQAFSAIPPNVTGDDHFLIVQTLLRGGAAGSEVDEALHAAVTAHKKSHRLIEMLVQFKANITEQTLFAAVSQGSSTILDALLAGQVPGKACAAAIAVALKLPMSENRFKIISKLLGPATEANPEVQEVSQAVVFVLQNFPEDLDLLHLLCQKGKANLNYDNGAAVVLATKHSNLTLSKIVLQVGVFPPSTATIERALNCAMNLPLTDANRHKKIKALLYKVKPQAAMNKALMQEITSTQKLNQQSAVVHILLDAGADPNTEDGSALRLAVRDPLIMDLLLSKRPTVRSVSLAFPSAISLPDPARFILCEKLLKHGAAGEEVSKALAMISEEGPDALSLMRLLLPHADVNFGQGHALRMTVKKVFIEGLDLLLNSRTSIASPASKANAFQVAMKLSNKEDRSRMVERLLKAGVIQEASSDALINAVNSGDVELAETFLRNGASVEHKGGQAVCSAASAGNTELLRLLVAAKPTLSTLVTGFGGALSLTGEAYHQTLEILLEGGLRGEAVDDALIETVRHGDSSLKMTELLCKNGASVEWNDGEAIVIAVRTSMLLTLDLLLTRDPSQAVLRRAYIAAGALPKEQRIQVIDRLLKAGKQVDNYVTKSLTTATMESPSDRPMIKMLLARGIFDEGQAMAHAARSLDLRTLSMLVNSPKAPVYISSSFEAVVITDEIWHSATSLAVVKVLLEKGATGPAVAEALYQAVASLENLEEGSETLAYDYIDVFLKHNADVNYQHGLALQRATLQANIPLITRLLPNANAESKAMSIPYVFNVCEDKIAVLSALDAFSQSFDHGEASLDIMFRHPNEDLEPVLFMALDKFPRDTQILRTLLDMDYPPNQWQFCKGEDDLEAERWPILCWALEQPEKRISTSVIEMLIDAGANVNYTSKTGITPLNLAIQNQRVEIVSKLISKGVSVSTEDSEGISPLALASSMNNLALMSCLCEADAEVDDGSLHDCARELRIDKMRILLQYGHHINYPSDRHDGRSALSELCLHAVDASPPPTQKALEKTIQFLITNDANLTLRTISSKALFHYALDSSNPPLILSALLKIMWEHINTDAFLYSDKTYTYSLTYYITKKLSLAPSSTHEESLALLRKKQAQDRFWAHDILVPQPPDYCNGPPHIAEEVLRQKTRERRNIEMREDAQNLLDLKRKTAVTEVEISQISHNASLVQTKDRARLDRELAQAAANTQLQISQDAWNQTSHLQQQARISDLQYEKNIQDVRVSAARRIKEGEMEVERTRNVLQIEFEEQKVEVGNRGVRERLMIEEQGAEGMERVYAKGHEREMVRLRMQKQLIGQQEALAGRIQGGASGGNIGGGWPGQRQITSGFVSET